MQNNLFELILFHVFFVITLLLLVVQSPLSFVDATIDYDGLGFAPPLFTMSRTSIVFDQATESFAVDASDDAIYRYGYISIDGAPWEVFELTGPTYGGNWLKNTATVSISLNRDTLNLTSTPNIDNYVLLYSCTRNGLEWDCHQNRWQIEELSMSLPHISCDDGIQNGDETGIDCGGNQCVACGEQGAGNDSQEIGNNSSNNDANVVPEGAFLSYSFDSDASDGTGDHDGQVVGATWHAKGTSGYYSFDGNDAIVAQDTSSSDGLNQVSVEAWVYNPSLQRYEYIIVKRRDGDSSFGLFSYDGGTYSFFINDYASNQLKAYAATNKWEHIVGTWDGETMAIYVDGELQYTKDYDEPMVTNPNVDIVIGAREAGTNSYNHQFSGDIGEAHVYDVALSSLEVQQRYEDTRGKYVSVNGDSDGDGVLDVDDCSDFDASLWQYLIGYTDNDGDSYTVGSAQQVCSGQNLPNGYITAGSVLGTDCDDGYSNVHPGANEVCGDGRDNDCSGGDLACPVTCDDGIKNGDETGVDCGGSNCQSCGDQGTGNPATHTKVFDSGQRYPFWEYLPKGYDSNRAQGYPMIVFLHGAGEAGSDLNKVLNVGPPHLINTNQWDEDLPFIVISPQSSGGFFNYKHLENEIEYFKTRNNVDTTRVYLTGLSAGGISLYNYLALNPLNDNNLIDDIAAVVPIAGKCSACDANNACLMKYPAMWAFHGSNDGNVGTQHSINIVSWINDCNPHTQAKVTIYPGVGHNSWSRTYSGSGMGTGDPSYDPFDQDIYSWMLEHTTCDNGVQNSDEQGVDCGGSCSISC